LPLSEDKVTDNVFYLSGRGVESLTRSWHQDNIKEGKRLFSFPLMFLKPLSQFGYDKYERLPRPVRFLLVVFLSIDTLARPVLLAVELHSFLFGQFPV